MVTAQGFCDTSGIAKAAVDSCKNYTIKSPGKPDRIIDAVFISKISEGFSRMQMK